MLVLRSVEVPPPPPPPPPPAPPKVGVGLTLVGVDGSTWDLVNGPISLPEELAGGSVTALLNVIGLGDAEVEHTWADGGILDGSRHQAMRYLPRAVTVPVAVMHPDSLGWRDLDAAFSAAIAPDGECQLIVTTPDAQSRQLTMRRNASDAGYERDPMKWGRATYDCQFIAADPFWRGETVARRFRTVEAPPFFAAPGSGFVLHIASSESTDSATINNLGHVRAWPRYTATGPVAGFTVGVGDNTVVYGPVADGASVVVDTHPAQQTIKTGTGADAWSGLLDRKFAPIEPGLRVALNLTLAAPGVGAEVLVELTPGYRRAW